MAFFDGFQRNFVDVGEVTLYVRHGGEGPAVLLLHGHPRTHATWHRVAAMLATNHTVVCPDLRGYGRSSKPVRQPDHAHMSKRAMANDLARLMSELGHSRYAVVGHDRGALVAFRLAMEHPHAVERLMVLDSIPVADILARSDARFAQAWWHWFFFAVADKPERAIGADPDAWYGSSTPEHRERMGAEAHDDFLAAIHDPSTVKAMLDDYRAGLGVDRRIDESDRSAGRRLACPLRVLWAEHDDAAALFGDLIGIWRGWADSVSGGSLACGHHMAEEAPTALAAEIEAFVVG